ncbi:hypothetical protein AB1460_23535 [Parafrankia sp. FMc2]
MARAQLRRRSAVGVRQRAAVLPAFLAALEIFAALSMFLVGAARPSAAAPRPPGAAEGTRLDHYFDDPLARQAFALRVATTRVRSSFMAFDPWKNAAVILIDPRVLRDDALRSVLGTRIDDSRSRAAIRGAMVDLVSMRDYLPADAYRKLLQEGVPNLLALGALNQKNAHSEISLENRLKNLATVDGQKIEKLAGFSERQQCETCTPSYDSTVPTFYLEEYGLTPDEIAERNKKLADPANSAASAQKAIEDHYGSVRTERAATAARNLEKRIIRAQDDFARDQGLQGAASAEILRPPAAGGCGDKPQGMSLPGAPPHLLAQAVSAAIPCGGAGQGRSEPGEAGQSGAGQEPSTGLGRALADADIDPGGIDFSSLELRYLADTGDDGLAYSFSAGRDARSGDPRAATGLAAARQTSDAFFVWLALPPSTFWVNLNPDEPDRIVDDQLGRTDVGRILLQADLEMKKTDARLIHPDTELGRQFWDHLVGDCMSSRLWIMPEPATVREDGDSLYILDAPLDVRTEAMYLQAQPSGGGAPAAACLRQDEATTRHNEELYRTLVLPRLKEIVNTGPEYAELRRVYLARVAAEWYRSLSARGHTTYGHLIDSGDIGEWTTDTGWKPTDTFQDYVRSYTEGEFNLTRETVEGDAVIRRTYRHGGVDLSSVPLNAVGAAEMDKAHPRLPETVQASLGRVETGTYGSIWLGGAVPAADRGLLTEVTDAVGDFLHSGPGLLTMASAAAAVLLLWFRSGYRVKHRRPL